MVKRYLILATILCLFVLSLGTAGAQSGDTWTILVYMEADNNLEGDALVDIQEMEYVGSSDEVNFVVQIDRAEDYSTGDGDWTDARRYLITQNANSVSLGENINLKFEDPASVRLNTSPLENMGEINNGDAQTLIDFIVWGTENYPAEKYGLILWNHGGTWIGGFGGDESTENHDAMDMLELDAALDLATEAMGQKFEFIGFDTCLMGQYEVFQLLSKYANYASGSEELEPGFGWFYAPVFESLVNNPAMSGADLSQIVVEAYQYFYDDFWLQFAGETYSDFYGGDVYGQTAVDLAQMDALTQAMSQFTSMAIANMDANLIAAIGDARNNTQMFMLSQPDDADVIGTVDLMHFMELLQRFSTNAEVNSAAQGVIDALNNLILLHKATNMPGARGVAIYFPANERLYTTGGLNTRYGNEAPFMTEWVAFLESFYGTAQVTAQANVGRVDILEVESAGDTISTLNPATIVFETEGTNIVSLGFSAILYVEEGVEFMIDQASLESTTVDEDGEPIIDFTDGIALSQYTWEVDMPVVTDGNVTIPTVLLETGDSESVVVTGLYGYPNGETLDAYVVFDTETQKAVKVWGINVSEAGEQPFEIDVRSGDEFLPTWRYFDENGELQLTTANDVLVFGSTPFSYEYVPAESGEYELYIRMEDVAGNIFYDFTTLVVDNEGVDTTYRGYNDTNYGYRFIYPWDWVGAIDVEFSDGIVRTVYVDNIDRLSVLIDVYDVATLEELEEITLEYMDAFADEYEDSIEIEIDDNEAYEVDYFWVNDEGKDAYGTIFYVYSPVSDYGYVVDYQVIGEPTDEDYVYYEAILEYMSFFPISDDGIADVGSVEALLAEYGYTVAEFDELLAEEDLTVADLQAMVDAGDMTITELEDILIAEEE